MFTGKNDTKIFFPNYRRDDKLTDCEIKKRTDKINSVKTTQSKKMFSL